MGKEEIVARILSDAEAEAAEIIRNAEKRAQEITDAAKARAAEEMAETKAEAGERAKRISEGKAAAARLESAKILLAEKRRVLDEIYSRALKELLALNEKDSLKLIERLLDENAEEGDIIVPAKNFAYASGVEKLSVVKARGLTLSSERAEISGGLLLRGKKSDKDLSYSALLNADKEEYQAEIAAQLFGDGGATAQ